MGFTERLGGWKTDECIEKLLMVEVDIRNFLKTNITYVCTIIHLYICMYMPTYNTCYVNIYQGTFPFKIQPLPTYGGMVPGVHIDDGEPIAMPHGGFSTKPLIRHVEKVTRREWRDLQQQAADANPNKDPEFR